MHQPLFGLHVVYANKQASNNNNINIGIDNEVINPAIRNAIRNDDGTEGILLRPVYRKLYNVENWKNIRKKGIKNS